MSRGVALLLSGSLLIIFLGILALIQPPASPLSGGGREGFPCRDFTESSIKVNDRVISVALADTPTEQARGLSGCQEIPENSGMLFAYSPAQDATFWMKDMLIPLDIIWIRDGEVIGIKPNIQPPLPHPMWKQGDDLPLYKSPGSITAVLELAAGKSSALDIKAGTRVE